MFRLLTLSIFLIFSVDLFFQSDIVVVPEFVGEGPCALSGTLWTVTTSYGPCRNQSIIHFMIHFYSSAIPLAALDEGGERSRSNLYIRWRSYPNVDVSIGLACEFFEYWIANELRREIA